MARNKAQNQLDMLQTAKEIYIVSKAKLDTFAGNTASDEGSALMQNMFNARDFMIDAYVDAAKMSRKMTAQNAASFDQIRRRAKLNPVYRDELIATIISG